MTTVSCGISGNATWAATAPGSAAAGPPGSRSRAWPRQRRRHRAASRCRRGLVWRHALAALATAATRRSAPAAARRPRAGQTRCRVRSCPDGPVQPVTQPGPSVCPDAAGRQPDLVGRFRDRTVAGHAGEQGEQRFPPGRVGNRAGDAVEFAPGIPSPPGATPPVQRRRCCQRQPEPSTTNGSAVSTVVTGIPVTSGTWMSRRSFRICAGVRSATRRPPEASRERRSPASRHPAGASAAYSCAWPRPAGRWRRPSSAHRVAPDSARRGRPIDRGSRRR